MALSWLLGDERITSVLVGISRLDQLRDNVAAAGADALSDEEARQIEAILNQS